MRTVFLRQAGSIDHEDRIPTTSREHSSRGPYILNIYEAVCPPSLYTFCVLYVFYFNILYVVPLTILN